MDTTKSYVCPSCGAGIALADVNPSTDVALCRVCGKIHSFAQLNDSSQDEAILATLPKGISVQKTLHGVNVEYKGSKGPAFFLCLFAFIFGGIPAIIAYMALSGAEFKVNGVAQQGASPELMLMLVPFFLIDTLVWVFVFYCFFGTNRLELSAGRGVLFRGLGSVGRRKSFVLSSDARVEVAGGSFSVNHQQKTEVFVTQPTGKTFHFGALALKDEQKEYIAAFLRQWVKNS